MAIDKQHTSTKQKSSQKQGFLQNFLDSIFKTSDPEVEKKRRLKMIAKNYQKSKYHNFYKISTLEIMPSFAKLFYEIYKIISPVQSIFRADQSQGMYKNQIINFSISESQQEILDALDEHKIIEMSKQIPLQNLQQTVEEKLAKFTDEFTPERIAKAENLYRTFNLFKDFCTFDYYRMLKKFCSRLVENNFSATPDFVKINAEYVVDDLKDFVEVAYVVTDEHLIWTDLFEFLKMLKGGTELITITNWKKIVAKIKSIQAALSFDLMIKHISSNPLYEPRLQIKVNSIIEPYMDKISEDTNRILAKINSAQKESKANSFCEQIFGNQKIQILKYYVSGFNEVLGKKDLGQFIYTEPLNYLKAFLVEFVKTDVREYYEVVCIRGQWDASLSAPMSNAYQELLKTSDDITAFDEQLSEDGAYGLKIKTLLPKTAHDPGAENIVKRVVTDSNDFAKKYIMSSTQNLIILGRTLKQLIEDHVKQKPEIVQNWRELEKYFEMPLKDFAVTIYKKIYLFVQLMQQYM